MKINNLIDQIQIVDRGLKSEANKAINQLLTFRNWLIGYYIVEYEQNGDDRAKYGEKLIPTLVKKLNSKGFSYTNLNIFRQFYIIFPEILQTVSEELKKIVQTPSELFIENPNRKSKIEFTNYNIIGKLSKSDAKFTKENIFLTSKIIQKLSFSHITLLLPLDEKLKRDFYSIEAIKGTWTVREMKRQINSLLFERSGLSKKPELLIDKINSALIKETQTGLVKDVYTFEFLELPISDAVEESELETALLDHLHQFILELGNGFCLESRQKRILIGNEYFYIDLVFYHRILKCHVLIELKVNQFNHNNAGQLNTYLNYYKKEIKEKNDNDPIGILMVAQKNSALVEYATAGMDENLFVSKYLLKLPSKEKLEFFLKNELKRL